MHAFYVLLVECDSGEYREVGIHSQFAEVARGYAEERAAQMWGGKWAAVICAQWFQGVLPLDVEPVVL
jgi:hypothetical protein